MALPNWLRRFMPSAEPPQYLNPESLDPGDWVVLPYRLAEAARISMYTIASHPEVPDNLRWWIVQWLTDYNSALATWFFQNYGPAIFPVLTEITNGVREFTEQHATAEASRAVDEAFKRWEKELDDGRG